MHGATRLIIVLFFVFTTCWGCGGSPDLLKQIPTTVNTVKSAKGLTKKVALILARTPETPIGRTVGEQYLKTLGTAINDGNSLINLLTPQDENFPGFLSDLSKSTTASVNAVALTEKGRQTGYQGLITAGINDIRAVAKKTGYFWLRKTRHFIHYSVTVDLYDPYTAAKIVSEVVEDSIKINEEEYDEFQSGSASSIKDLTEVIDDLARDHGERIAEALGDHRWKAAVISVENGRIYLPAFSEAGLAKGDRLAVFEGRRILESTHGEKFIAPGVKIGEIEITAMTGPQTEAKLLTSETIQAGDIVIPLR